MLLGSIAALLLMTAGLAAAEVQNGFFTTSDDVRLHYLEAGKGPALFFEPGWTMPAWIWQAQIDALSKNYRVVVIDPRSQGESQVVTEGHYCERRARDMKELVDHLKLHSVALAGWSQGVSETLCYVDQFGTGNISAIILVDGGFGTESDPQVKVQSWRRFEEMQKDRRAFAEHFVRGMYQKPHPEEYYRKVVEASLITPTNTAVLMAANSLMKPDYRHILFNVNRPVLYAGRADSRRQGEILKSLVPWARVEIFEDCGHALFVDDPERFNRVVDEFLRGVTPVGM
jgi:microsomal epoxide hydrolase